jgi:DNA-binding transcriptional LysR family regulator
MIAVRSRDGGAAILDGVTLEQLRTLRAVAEEGSFSAAARQLGRVQAAVSQAIDRLEAQLGLRLFDRTGRVPTLTSHGHAVVAAASKVTLDFAALEELVANLSQGTERTLRIVVDVLLPTSSLVSFAQDFAREHPKVGLVLFSDILSAVTAHVRERRSAWGVAVEDANLDQLERRTIAEVQLIPVAAPAHPLAARPDSLDSAALADAVQIVLGEHGGGGDPAPRTAAADNDQDVQGVFSPRTWRVVDLATKQALIAGGLGWGHLPEHLVRADLDAGRLVKLRLDAWSGDGPRRALVLVWRPNAVLGPVARWAQERLSHLCREATSA